jgi:hypothetical protein
MNAAEPPDFEQVSKFLSEAKTMAFQLKEDAATMESFTRMNVGLETHAVAINPINEYDSEEQSEMGGERGCNRAGHFHCRAVWHRRVTPKSIEQPPIAVGACSTEFRNETGGRDHAPWALKLLARKGEAVQG